MIKNQSNIYQFVLRDMIGQGMTGLSPTVQIRKDSGSFANTTNTPTEVGNGAYEVILTATECNCDVMMFMVTLPDGQFPAILTNEYLTTTGGATPAEIWEYSGGRTVTNTIPTASDNATAVWGAQTKEVTIATAQADTFATASSVANIATVAGAIKAKTDTIPQNPAAQGTQMSLTNEAIAAVKYGLSTFDPSVSTVTINSTQAATFATSTAQTSILALLETLYSGLYHWEVNNNTLTIYDADGLAISAYTLTKDAIGNIIAVTPEE